MVCLIGKKNNFSGSDIVGAIPSLPYGLVNVSPSCCESRAGQPVSLTVSPGSENPTYNQVMSCGP